MLRKNLFLLAAIVFCISINIYGQNTQIASVYHDVHKINSKILNEERSIWVRVPLNYERTDEKLPVVYMLDGHAPQPSMMAGIIEQQAWGGKMPEMILVSIQNTNRTRDMTPTKTERVGSGGADNFLQFIETEVIPLVEKNYRTQPFRIIAGHSLGGMLAVYSFVARPDLFNAYIAASPHLQWDNNAVIKRAEESFKQNRDWKKTMFLCIGDEPDYVNSFNTFQDLLKKAKPKNFEYEFRQFKGENHGSVVLPAYYAGLRKVFEGWETPTNGSLTDLENHHKKLSQKFGYQILIPEATLNQVGYQLLRTNRIDEAISAFKRNVENYPNSANVYDSLAEAFEKNGQLKQSAENYEKAYKMAEKSGETQLAQSAKANFERISAKLK